MNSFKDRKLFLAYSGDFKKQSAFDVPLATADINTRHPQTQKVFPGRTITREEIRDCTGEYVIREDITSRLSRLNFAFDADARLISGWLALAQGAAGAPSGTQTAFIWTFTVTGTLTAGFFTVNHTFEGITDSVDIPYNASNADVVRLLGTLRTLKPNNVLAGGTPLPSGPFTITGTAKLAAGPVTLPTIVNTGLTGGTVAIAQTVAGANKTALITRTTSDQTPLTSFITGFEGDSTNPDKYKNSVVNQVTIKGQLRGKVSVELEVIGSADLIEVFAYSVPACVNVSPIYTKDCRIQIDGTFIATTMREFTYVYNNNIFTGDDPFPYDDIDVVRLEHGDRASNFTFSIYGSKGDSLYTLAEAETAVAVNLILGPPVNRVKVNAPKASVRLDDNPVTFAGEALRSAIGLNSLPFFDQAISGTPDNVIYYGPESVTLLAT